MATGRLIAPTPTAVGRVAGAERSDRLWLAALALAPLSGLLAAAVMPRGPVTTAQALVFMGAAVAVGAASGYLIRARWALLSVPLAHLLAFELGRWGAAGPTVDLPRLDSVFGVLALLLGRGVYTVLGLLPMVLGVAIGRAAAHRAAGARVRRLRLAVPALLLAVLAGWLALPGRTPPILGADGRPLPGSIAALERVELGGSEQWIMVRGASVSNPVLLYLSGGPGQSDLPYARALLGGLTSEFLLVAWDQRGTGKSYPAFEPVGELTLQQAVADTIELAEHLRARFGAEKIYLLGESWGSTLGVLAVQQRPDLFHAYIGSGQMVSQSLTDRIIWRDLLALAEREGDWRLYDRLITFGEPPYREVPWGNAFAMNHYGRLYAPYTPPQPYVDRLREARLGFFGVLGSEYTLIEKVNALRGLIDMFTVMYPQLQEIDFRRDVPALEVPVYVLDGQAELQGRRSLALEWFDRLEAPRKHLYTFENAAHAAAFEEADALREIAVTTILPETQPR